MSTLVHRASMRQLVRPRALAPRGLQTRVRYNRAAAVRYALRHWNNPNPRFANMDTFGAGGDCANFVSQCFAAGNRPFDYRAPQGDREWWYRHIGDDRFDRNGDDWWSCTWAVAESLFQYLRANGGTVYDLNARPRLARRLRRGDAVFYDWEGDGVINHSSIVTGFSRRGEPLVTYRTLRPQRPVRNALWTLRRRRRGATRIFGVRLNNDPERYSVAPDFTRLRPCDSTRG